MQETWNAPNLRRSMAAGAIYDLGLGLSIVVALEFLSSILPIPFPSEPFYARVVGVLLIGLGVFYGIAALDLRGHVRNVGGAVLVRTFGGTYLIAYAALDASVSWCFLVFGIVDLMWALLHVVLLHHETNLTLRDLLSFRDEP